MLEKCNQLLITLINTLVINSASFQKPALELVSAELVDFPECKIGSWEPVIEPNFGQERFLTDDPMKLFRSGAFAKVNVLAGVTADEFLEMVPCKTQRLIENTLFNACCCFRYFG